MVLYCQPTGHDLNQYWLWFVLTCTHHFKNILNNECTQMTFKHNTVNYCIDDNKTQRARLFNFIWTKGKCVIHSLWSVSQCFLMVKCDVTWHEATMSMMQQQCYIRLHHRNFYPFICGCVFVVALYKAMWSLCRKICYTCNFEPIIQFVSLVSAVLILLLCYRTNGCACCSNISRLCAFPINSLHVSIINASDLDNVL